jgi:ubiquinone/menaquinone biosynthesis C-methylase UbiE
MPAVSDGSFAVQKRFAETAAAVAELQDRRAEEERRHLTQLLTLGGDERVLDVGTGAGAFALALAPFVREVVGVDLVPELLAEARKRAPGNAEFLELDATSLPFPPGSFDVVTTARTLHHTARPELVLAEMTRVLRPGGTMVVVDQLAPGDPLAAIELNRFERARDPSTTRVLADVDLRGLFDANSLVLRRAETVSELRDLDRYLDLAGCAGEEREHARSLAPSQVTGHYGWYVLAKPAL